MNVSDKSYSPLTGHLDGASLQEAAEALQQALLANAPAASKSLADSVAAGALVPEAIDPALAGSKISTADPSLLDGTVLGALPGPFDPTAAPDGGLAGFLADRRAGLGDGLAGSGPSKSAPDLRAGDGLVQEGGDLAAYIDGQLAGLRQGTIDSRIGRTEQASEDAPADGASSGAPAQEEKDDDEGILDAVVNFLGGVVGAIVGGATNETAVGKGVGGPAGGIAGGALTIITSNTSSPEDKANEFRGWAAFVRMANGEYYDPRMKDADDDGTRTPTPDGGDSTPNAEQAVGQILALGGVLEDGPQLEIGADLIGRPADDSRRPLPPRESLETSWLGNGSRVSNASTPTEEDSGSGVQVGGADVLDRPRPNVVNPVSPTLGGVPSQPRTGQGPGNPGVDGGAPDEPEGTGSGGGNPIEN